MIVRSVHRVLQVAPRNHFCLIVEGLEYPLQTEGEVLAGGDVHLLGDLDVLIGIGVHEGIVILCRIAAAAIIAAEAAVFAGGGAVTQQLSPVIIRQFPHFLDEQAVFQCISLIQSVSALSDIVNEHVAFKDDVELIGPAVRLVGDQSVRPGEAKDLIFLLHDVLVTEVDGIAHIRGGHPGAVFIALQAEGDPGSRRRRGGSPPHDLVDPGIRHEAVQLVLQDHQVLYFPDIFLGDLFCCVVHDQVAGAAGCVLPAVPSGAVSLTVAVPAGNSVLHTASAVADRGLLYSVVPLPERVSR